jgi:hypothetical protein
MEDEKKELEAARQEGWAAGAEWQKGQQSCVDQKTLDKLTDLQERVTEFQNASGINLHWTQTAAGSRFANLYRVFKNGPVGYAEHLDKAAEALRTAADTLTRAREVLDAPRTTVMNFGPDPDNANLLETF